MNPEQAKYDKLWSGFGGQYRNFAPGEHLVGKFLAVASPRADQLCYDYGCGTGRAAARIAEHCRVVGFDFSEECRDDDVVGKFVFRQHDLLNPVSAPTADFGFCTDVMEHIAPEDVRTVLRNIVGSSKQVFFAISLVEDSMGALIGEPLHLTVQPAAWWKKELEGIGFAVHTDYEADNYYIAYGSAWEDFKSVIHRTCLNVDDNNLVSNIRANLKLGVPSVHPHNEQSQDVMLLCGGPSLNDFTDEILEKHRAGMPVFTVNGTYNWLLERGGVPGAQIVVDARAFNSRFVTPVHPKTRYLISSQCDPTLAASLPADRTMLWHVAGKQAEQALKEAGIEKAYPVPGGTTVTNRAIPLMVMLGFRNIHIYGFDSCLRGDEHHAYSQPENDGVSTLSVKLNGREYLCHGWMLKQAEEFQLIIKHLLKDIDVNLCIYGDGLIAEILKSAANAQEGK